ncbi:MAG: glycosyltransferase family 39 protein, partial [Candidatus Omnitrophica bacterium]|nr:glycosyltransferase family 39 protein [Candidatus Omnitrophota bacterium]
MRLSRKEILFLSALYLGCVAIRLLPRLGIDPHLLTFDADIWYRLCLAQFVLENGHPPVWDIRYSAYGHVPFWYTPIALYIYAFLAKISSLDLPTVTSRIMPWVESTAIIPFYFLARYLYGLRVAIVASVCLALTPAFLFWSAIGTPQGFTMFCIPLAILLWVTFVRKEYIFGNRLAHFLLFALLLTVNFLTHLT